MGSSSVYNHYYPHGLCGCTKADREWEWNEPSVECLIPGDCSCLITVFYASYRYTRQVPLKPKLLKRNRTYERKLEADSEKSLSRKCVACFLNLNGCWWPQRSNFSTFYAWLLTSELCFFVCIYCRAIKLNFNWSRSYSFKYNNITLDGGSNAADKHKLIT